MDLCISAIFAKGNKLCNLLFGSLDVLVLSKFDLL